MTTKNKLEGKDSTLLEFYKQRLSDEKIAKIFNVCTESIRIWRVRNNLPPVGRVPAVKGTLKSSIIRLEEFEELYYLGYNDREISEKLKVNSTTVHRFRNSLGLNPVEQYADIKLTYEQEQVLLGHTLGDGSLRKIHLNASGKIEQSLKQKDYFMWKYRILFPLTNGKINENARFDNRTNKTYHSISSYLPTHPILTQLYDITYINGKKELNKQNLFNFEDLALAVLFMDDGGKCINGYQIATNSFSQESLTEFKNLLFYRFHIECTIPSNNEVYILKNKSKIQFESIVSKYIIPSMQYKLYKTVPLKSDKLLETPEEDNQQPITNLND